MPSRSPDPQLLARLARVVAPIQRLRWANYDPATHTIEPIGPSRSDITWAVATQFDSLVPGTYTLIGDRLKEWKPYTHLIRFDGSAVYAMVKFRSH